MKEMAGLAQELDIHHPLSLSHLTTPEGKRPTRKEAA